MRWVGWVEVGLFLLVLHEEKNDVDGSPGMHA